MPFLYNIINNKSQKCTNKTCSFCTAYLQGLFLGAFLYDYFYYTQNGITSYITLQKVTSFRKVFLCMIVTAFFYLISSIIQPHLGFILLQILVIQDWKSRITIIINSITIVFIKYSSQLTPNYSVMRYLIRN